MNIALVLSICIKCLVAVKLLNTTRYTKITWLKTTFPPSAIYYNLPVCFRYRRLSPLVNKSSYGSLKNTDDLFSFCSKQAALALIIIIQMTSGQGRQFTNQIAD